MVVKRISTKKKETKKNLYTRIPATTHCDKIDGRGRQLIRREWIDNKRLDENEYRARGWRLNATTLCLERCLDDEAQNMLDTMLSN